ncbi:MAG: MBOAT family protein [Halioglobus sp.]
MLFNSLHYLILFLPITWLVYQWLGRGQLSRFQLLWLVAASLFFYACWSPLFLGLMLASIGMNFLLGEAISDRRSRPLMILGVCLNLGILGYFKYTGFFLENLNTLTGMLVPMPAITLPLAISFFTFQQIAYLVDAYRGEAKDYSFQHYCLFVSFFPQLVAGPIVHHKEMMPQFDKPVLQKETRQNLQVGLTIIALGLFKKVVLADSLSVYVDPVFSQAGAGDAVSTLDAWLAVIAFSGQIYFDFSGYTDIAIGSARLFGIKLPENFFSPYKANSIIDFWRRWHITLSRFLRDYLYFTLGGNRQGIGKRYRNLAITMLLGGLWHGAHWNFVIWGGLHGLYLVINHGWRHVLPNNNSRPERLMTRLCYRLLTLAAVIFAWVYFRAESVQAANAVIGALFGQNSFGFSNAYLAVMSAQPAAEFFALLNPGLPAYTAAVAIVTGAFFLCLLAPNTQQWLSHYQPVLPSQHWPRARLELIPYWRPNAAYSAIIAMILFLSLLGMGSISEFIYFQF